MTAAPSYTAYDVAEMLRTGEQSPRRAEYERRKREWIAAQLENCPPLSEDAKNVIRTAFAEHRMSAPDDRAVRAAS